MQKKISPIQKKHLIFFALGIILFVISIFASIYLLSSNYLTDYNYRTLKSLSKNIATISEIGFFLAMGLFVLRFLIKDLSKRGVTLINKPLSKFKVEIPETVSNAILENSIFKKFKSFLMPIAKLFQRYHIILALIAGTIILIHGSIFLYLGFKWDIGYIFGILAIINLFILIISGVFRIFNKNIIPHKYLGISFIILMCLHILFV